MEVVTLVHVTLNRIGTASESRGLRTGASRQRKFTVEVTDSAPAALRDLVIEIAEANGESEGSLENLTLSRQYAAAGESTFDIQVGNTYHGAPYCVCQVQTALKANGQYFELRAIDVQGFAPYAANAHE
ncbi:hypothetical protein [Pseudomonas sp. p21]|uniref:hypothetical protein n=1 Tax=Pseudomonas sp. p21 TaxID=1825979 RepID=UPI0007C7674F|nr:hypothetical protein [Pseudomonas sp. p21]